MNSDGAANWFYDKRESIRVEAGHDAEKFEALVLDPALEREARERFPDDPILYAQLRAVLETELTLAKRGIFLLDGPPTEEQIAELRRRNREELRLLKWSE